MLSCLLFIRVVSLICLHCSESVMRRNAPCFSRMGTFKNQGCNPSPPEENVDAFFLCVERNFPVSVLRSELAFCNVFVTTKCEGVHMNIVNCFTVFI